MTTWITAPGFWTTNRDKIVEICRNNFGQEHTKTWSKITKRGIDNHGNWELRGDTLKFRYQKDYAWFMLQASHLQDQYKSPMFSYTRSTGPK